MKSEIIFLSDSSFDPESKSGVAGFITVADVPAALLAPPVVELTSFQNTTCTRLEIESVLIVLQRMREQGLANNTVYTDCKTVVDLAGRRLKLEAGGYIGKSSGNMLHNADIYRIFYRLCDEVTPVFVWIKGHQAEELRDSFGSLFSMVDKSARKALRELIGKA